MPVALFFDPDAYFVEGRAIVGRRAAGAAFLRAAVEGRCGDPVIAYAGRKKDTEKFADVVRQLDPAARSEWIPINRTDMLARVGTLFRPDPALGSDARIRLRSGPAAYSLCGITHTISSTRALEAISQIVTETIMPWDALICTSTAALGVVQNVLEATLDHHRWRMRITEPPKLPQLPIIPLGVHCSDFAPSESKRHEARNRLGLAEDEVAILFAGRLSFATKAHPFQMYDGLRLAAERSGKRLVLIQAGQASNAAAAKAIKDATAAYCTGVRAIFASGADASLYAAAFAGADLFMSLSDNIQETFGITPIEAMASGLPVIVSDWNGYRDTVRNGIDGFRITSRAPQPGVGRRIAQTYQIDKEYEAYTSRASSTVSMDMAELVGRLTELIEDPALRRRMGEAARARALADYDWAVVYRRYRELWDDLTARRRHALADSESAAWVKRAPMAHPANGDPWSIFAHYPTQTIGAATLVRIAPEATLADYERLIGQPIFELWRMPSELTGRLMATAASAPLAVADLAKLMERSIESTIEMVGRLAKMNLLIIETGADNVA